MDVIFEWSLGEGVLAAELLVAVLAVVRGELHATHGADLAHVLLAMSPRTPVDVLLSLELGQECVAPGRNPV